MKTSGAYTALYDQAGLMVRADEVNWMKCGIEFVDGIQHVSAVVTRDYSDWSVVPLPQRVSEKPWGRLSSLPGQTGKSAPHSPFQTSSQNPPALWLRVTRTGSTVVVHYSLDGADYTLHRTAYLPLPETVCVGLMCAAPEGEGFPATFEDLTIRQLQEQ